MANVHSRGFTLIELLVVIAIIGLLASVVLASLNGARKKGRDARRLADLKQLQVALELYYGDQTATAYPIPSGADSGQVSVTTLTALTSGGYIPALPDDPLGGSNHYVYRTTSAGQFYCLGAAMENTPPASSCNTTSLGASLTGTNLYSVGP